MSYCFCWLSGDLCCRVPARPEAALSVQFRSMGVLFSARQRTVFSGDGHVCLVGVEQIRRCQTNGHLKPHLGEFKEFYWSVAAFFYIIVLWQRLVSIGAKTEMRTRLADDPCSSIFQIEKPPADLCF